MNIAPLTAPDVSKSFSRRPPQVLIAVTAALVFAATIKGTSYILRRNFPSSYRDGPESEDGAAAAAAADGLLLCHECRARNVTESRPNPSSSSTTTAITTTGSERGELREVVHGSGTAEEKGDLLGGTRGGCESDEDRSDRTVLLDWTNSREAAPRGSQARLGSRITDRILGVPRIEKLREASIAATQRGWTRRGGAGGGGTGEPLSKPANNRSHSGASSCNGGSSSRRLCSPDHSEDELLPTLHSSFSSSARYPQRPPSPV